MIASFLKRVFGILLPIAVLVAAIYGAVLLIRAKPTTQKLDRKEEPVVVETVVVETVKRRIEVQGFGDVSAHRQLDVQAQVPGRVLWYHPRLLAGGRIEAGQDLVRIDERDYVNQVEEAKARVATARFELEVEEGRQEIAKREWKLLGESMEAESARERLALRAPHLEQRRAALAAAESALQFAEVQLSRTVIRAPFPALVLSEDVEVDRLLTAGASLARLVATDCYRVVVSLPQSELLHVRARTEDRPGSPAEVSLQIGASGVVRWQGEVERVLGEVSQAGRLARVMILVRDPFAGQWEKGEDFELLLGSYVRVNILCDERADLMALPRRALREGDTLWVFGPSSRLKIHPVKVWRRTEDEIWIESGVEPGDRVIVSPISVVGEGLLLEDAQRPADASSGKPALVTAPKGRGQ